MEATEDGGIKTEKSQVYCKHVCYVFKGLGNKIVGDCHKNLTCCFEDVRSSFWFFFKTKQLGYMIRGILDVLQSILLYIKNLLSVNESNSSWLFIILLQQ